MDFLNGQDSEGLRLVTCFVVSKSVKQIYEWTDIFVKKITNVTGCNVLIGPY